VYTTEKKLLTSPRKYQQVAALRPTNLWNRLPFSTTPTAQITRKTIVPMSQKKKGLIKFAKKLSHPPRMRTLGEEIAKTGSAWF